MPHTPPVADEDDPLEPLLEQANDLSDEYGLLDDGLFVVPPGLEDPHDVNWDDGYNIILDRDHRFWILWSSLGEDGDLGMSPYALFSRDRPVREAIEAAREHLAEVKKDQQLRGSILNALTRGLRPASANTVAWSREHREAASELRRLADEHDKTAGLIDSTEGAATLGDVAWLMAKNADDGPAIESEGLTRRRGSLVMDWDDLRPDGRVVYYEGDDPEGFAAEMLELGIDVHAPCPWNPWDRADAPPPGQ